MGGIAVFGLNAETWPMQDLAPCHRNESRHLSGWYEWTASCPTASMSPRSWHVIGAEEFYAPNASAFVRHVMCSLVQTVAASALSARSLSASVANLSGSRNAHITKARQGFEDRHATCVINSKVKSHRHSRNV